MTATAVAPDLFTNLLDSLNSEQLAVVEHSGPGPVVVAGVPGCLAGDTIIRYNRGRRVDTRPILLQELFLKFNGLRPCKDPWRDTQAPTYAYSMGLDGVARLNQIEAVVFSGTKPCVRVTDEQGNGLTCTEDHPFLMVDMTYLPAAELAKTCLDVLRLGSMKPVPGVGRKRQASRAIIDTKYHPHGWIHVVQATVRMRRPVDYFYRRVPRAKLVVEAAMNGLPYERFVQLLKTDESASALFHYLDPTLEVHHIDENPNNDTPGNLQVLTHGAHARLHGKTENFNVDYCRPARIVAVEAVGSRPTFDVMMRDPDRNFAASGFFVHNSGKTRTLTARIAWVAANGVSTDQLMAMTFTRAAAGEITERLHAVGIKCRVGTIHSVALELLQTYRGDLVHPLEIDSSDRMRWQLKRLLGEIRRMGPSGKWANDVDIEELHRYIAHAKLSGLTYVKGNPFGFNPQADEALRQFTSEYHSENPIGCDGPRCVHLFCELEDRRASAGLYDFDDMVNWAYQLLLSDATIRAALRQRYMHVIVDEMQDSNVVQWGISSMAAGSEDGKPVGAVNLMAGGDPSQSIYRFQGAHPEILAALCEHPQTRVYRLPTNYRSVPEVCRVAYALVSNKRWHIAGEIKAVRAAIEGAPALQVISYEDPSDEAKDAVRRCMEYAQSHQGNYRDCAILARIGVGLNDVELECIRQRIPYIKRASGSFADSVEVKDILAYLRVACLCDPEGKWQRHIVNTPFRYIGKDALAAAEVLAESRGKPFLDALSILPDLKPYQRRSIDDLYDLLRDLNKDAKDAERHAAMLAAGNLPSPLDEETNMAPTVGEMIGEVLRRTKYIESLRREEGLAYRAESREAIIGALQRIARYFSSPTQLIAYIDALSVAMHQAKRQRIRQDNDSTANALVISTIHQAKALEWDHVHLVDVTEGHLPHTFGDIEEELRLLYVAITRTKTTCVVSYAQDCTASSYIALLISKHVPTKCNCE